MWLTKKDEPPHYSERDPHVRPVRALQTSNYGFDMPEPHPALSDPRDSIFRVLQVDHRNDSIARLFDNALCLDFARFKDSCKDRSLVLQRQLGSDPAEGYIRSEVRVVGGQFLNGHHLVHTCLRVWASSVVELWDRFQRNRYSQANHQPCPRIFRENSPPSALFFPSHNFDDFSEQLYAAGNFEDTPSDQRCNAQGLAEVQERARVHDCRICETAFVAKTFKAGAVDKLNLELHTWHNVGTLKEPDCQWVRMAAVMYHALAYPKSDNQHFRTIKDWFEDIGP
ncbi:hypothetical protein K461DRAFT_90452 [Myriangium duriaei CBS 260.36]|uniref:Uncharacterized protein n=1 Tax=Myriangium duriaei CBS 260.36 TaxID=1168546 RepID=A0A9P4MKC5_9PEZI|nr:hypothetical protein K461DRAFT_90452 [Myriangium duriaei CBS 260.36]